MIFVAPGLAVMFWNVSHKMDRCNVLNEALNIQALHTIYGCGGGGDLRSGSRVEFKNRRLNDDASTDLRGLLSQCE